MTQLREIQAAIESVPEKEYLRLRQWFYERDWQEWDKQIETESANGKLDLLIQETAEAK